MEVAGRRDTYDEEEIFEDVVKECEPCKGEHIAKEANGICNECEEYMCDTCFRHHLKAKQCRNHVMIDIQNLSLMETHQTAKNVEKCKRHSNEQIKFYCRTHESVGCGECMIPDHSGCNAENIKDFAKGYELSEDFKRLQNKLERLVVANKENERKVREKDEANKTMYERALKDIRKFRKNVNDFLDNAEECILSEAKDIKKGNDKLLAKLDLDCKLLSSTIKEGEQTLDTQLYSEILLFIQTVDCKSRILDIEKAVSRVEMDLKVKEYEFVPNKQLQNLLCSLQSFGILASPIKDVPYTEENIEQAEENQCSLKTVDRFSIKDESVTNYTRKSKREMKMKKEPKKKSTEKVPRKRNFGFTEQKIQANTFPYRDRLLSPGYLGEEEEKEDYLIS